MTPTRGWLVIALLLAGCAATGLAGCAATVPIQTTADLSGEWTGRVTSPAGHALARLTIAPDGAFTGTMYLDAGDRPFRGSVLVVRPGQARYQGTDGNGVVRLTDDHGRPTLNFLRDDGGVDAVFRRF